MKIKVSITREYDTTGDDHEHLFEGVGDPVALALSFFADDIDALVTDNAVKEGALVEEIA
jgi:hypothetical protein